GSTNSPRSTAKVAWSSATSPPSYTFETPRNSGTGVPTPPPGCGRFGVVAARLGASRRNLCWRSGTAMRAGTLPSCPEECRVCRQFASVRAALGSLGGVMASVATTALENGLPLHRVGLDGTRAVTVLVGFDAGARTERPDENGMAHFLEHLVFKGGERYATYRDVNETAERLGAQLNAYTSHDLVAFHVTVRAESALEAADLLTDFVGRPRLDAEELDRERGVVVQEIARANDQPSTVAEHLIDEAAFGDHPLGRPVLGTAEHIRDTFTRDGIIAFRSRRWSPTRGAAFAVGNLQSLNGELDELFGRIQAAPEPDQYEPAPQFEPRIL